MYINEKCGNGINICICLIMNSVTMFFLVYLFSLYLCQHLLIFLCLNCLPLFLLQVFFFCKTFRIDLNRIISLVMIVHSRREISHVCKTSFPLVPPHWFSSEVTSTVILSEEFADLIPPWDRTSSAV